MTESISRLVSNIKTELGNPYIMIAGDFNGYDLSTLLQDYNDLKVGDSPPSRMGARLDLIISNLMRR